MVHWANSAVVMDMQICSMRVSLSDGFSLMVN